MTDALTATGLTIARGGRTLVEDLDLSLPRGAVTALTGPNGSGKSTTAWCLSLHDRDCSGVITVDGVPAREMSARSLRSLHRRTIALQPQDLLLEDSWSVARNLWHAAWSLALPWRQRTGLVTEVMARTGVTAFARRRVASLSGGERMRVALARTRLMREPALVVLDEPTAGSDESLGALVMDLMEEWTKAGAGVLVVTHDQRLVERADDVIRLGDEPSA
ncbi:MULTISPECIES: ATP-binding cassette domain-containing protein [Actinomyces]|uniref:ATP-binding cassette domain-containing protein n=1 Tax=Actinomyces respiraculi TaxID=2744574 RepID=A0A7T0LJ21_9ACTO|nr:MULTISPECIES: ATP-binding cassette domain-containing protein [Actinomyces]QPL04627.1 ATP-binding cassette domain-containing protein [Actinomyces respiraculi]